MWIRYQSRNEVENVGSDTPFRATTISDEKAGKICLIGDISKDEMRDGEIYDGEKWVAIDLIDEPPVYRVILEVRAHDGVKQELIKSQLTYILGEALSRAVSRDAQRAGDEVAFWDYEFKKVEKVS